MGLYIVLFWDLLVFADKASCFGQLPLESSLLSTLSSDPAVQDIRDDGIRAQKVIDLTDVDDSEEDSISPPVIKPDPDPGTNNRDGETPS